MLISNIIFDIIIIHYHYDEPVFHYINEYKWNKAKSKQTKQKIEFINMKHFLHTIKIQYKEVNNNKTMGLVCGHSGI